MVTDAAHPQPVSDRGAGSRHYAPVALFAAWWVLWLVVFQEAVLGAVAVWYQNETFHHGFLVLPVFIWVVQREWHRYPREARHPNLLIIGALSLTLLGWMAGFIGEVLVVQQLAAVAVVALAAALAFGWRFAIAAWFPLALLFFGVPLGEGLIPQLQELTAVLAVGLLKLTGIPVWVEGLYVHVAAGVFHVAEACSGIKFLMASAFFGFVAGYIQFQRPAKRLSFLGFCLLIPVLANVLRVYLTILIGLRFGMERVEGFDHLVYGWLLFAVIFVLIVWVALRFGDRQDSPPAAKAAAVERVKAGPVAAGYLPLLLIAAASAGLNLSTAFDSDLDGLTLKAEAPADWQPSFPGAAHQGFMMTHIPGVDTYLAEFDGTEADGKLVSSVNRLFDRQTWQVDMRRSVLVDAGEAELVVISAGDRNRAILSWYELPGGARLSSPARTKAQQVVNVLRGLGRGGRFVAVSTMIEGTSIETPPDRLLKAARAVIVSPEGQS